MALLRRQSIGYSEAMSEHVTLSLSTEQLAAARREAERLGVSVEAYLVQILEGRLAAIPPAPAPAKLPISVLFGLIPEGAGPPTDIATDKDKLIGEAVWKEHLRKTRQTE